jgi:hypothetical protein
MAITQTQALPAPFITALGEKYGTGLAGLADQPFTTAQLGQVAPQVAAQTGLQQQATTLAGQGVGSYAPYLTAAGAQGTAAGTTLGGVPDYIGAAGTQYAGAAGLTGAGAGTGTGTVADYMSPYQTQVIDTTLSEFDRQAAMRQQAISDAAVGVGGYGGGREGVMQSEYQTQSDAQRAALQAGLLQQGYTQALGSRQQDLMNRMGLGQSQLGLAGAQGTLAAQQMGLGQYQTGLGAQTQALAGQDVAALGRQGAIDQAQSQAVLDAQREANRMTLYEPYERMGFFGQGLTGLMGGYPAQYQSQIQPNPTPLQSALGIGSVLGGIYGNIRGTPQR